MKNIENVKHQNLKLMTNAEVERKNNIFTMEGLDWRCDFRFDLFELMV
jgi:hypothetical protein